MDHVEKVAKMQAVEKNLNEELEAAAKASNSLHMPINDGIVNHECYARSTPKMLWILKEPWENLAEGEAGGDWSLTHELANGLKSNKDTYPIMAYITYSVFHDYPEYDAIPYVTDSVEVAHALRHIAYINVSKLPGKSTSVPARIEAAYKENRSVLMRQIEAISPDVVIGGSTLYLFFQDLGLNREMFKENGSASFCIHEGVLYIEAHHPNQRSVKRAAYCNDITNVIQQHFSATIQG